MIWFWQGTPASAGSAAIRSCRLKSAFRKKSRVGQPPDLGRGVSWDGKPAFRSGRKWGKHGHWNTKAGRIAARFTE
jgi:hypothetical protein